MQKAMIVSTDDDVETLNHILEEGGFVSHMCPMTSSMTGSFSSHYAPTCLVIIEMPRKL